MNKILLELTDMSEQAGKDMGQDLHLPECDRSHCECDHEEPREITEEMGYCHEELSEEARSIEDKPNPDQEKVFHAVKTSVDYDEGRLFCN